MAKVEINTGVPQLPLVIKENGKDIPLNLDGLNGGTEIHRVLVGQKLWNERPIRSNNKILLVDTTTGFSGLLEHESLCFRSFTSTEEVGRKKHSAVIFIADEMSQEDTVLDLEDLISIKKSLTKSGVLFVFEKKPVSTEFDKDLRLERLRLANFKKIDVLTGLSKDFVVWRGRGEKTAKRKGVNFLDFSGDKFWRKDKIRKLYVAAKEEYENCGCRILTKKEIRGLKRGYEGHPVFERLKDSTNIPGDLSKLGNGFGLIIEGETCGCIIEIRLDGTQNRVEECKGGICQF